ncbi:MAG TPA: tannase/feruloyl esterase family alpha/beta hydrolase [Steroidobacter sp.]|uniref:tannase/feruloyl esterase family alpha/beta hydrolase n=1 Tax=Steroidobacter sp. TaxID=1978227 RepID=UPI002EDA4957
MAQRFPWVIDGIIAGCPVLSWSDLAIQRAWVARATRDGNNQLLLDQDSVTLLHEKALSQCDEDDGLKDGIIGNPATCKFNPAGLQCKVGQSDRCLDPEQVAVAKKLYSRPVDSAGQPIASTGLTPGSELSVLEPVSTRNAASEEVFRYMYFMPAPGAILEDGGFRFRP